MNLNEDIQLNAFQNRSVEEINVKARKLLRNKPTKTNDQ